MSLNTAQIELAPFPLLHTKQRPPQPRADWVARPRLLKLLDSSLTHPLTVLSAPAGFGKTTLLAQWSAETSLPLSWISLDADDNELTLFLAYLVAAVQRLFPGACAETAHMVSAIRPAPQSLLFTTLINEMDELGDPFILALDDYYLITDEAINEVLADLALAAPGGLRLVVATRSDPSLPLAKLRARGSLLEVRAAQLRFTEGETRLFLTPALTPALGAEVIAQVAEAIGGRSEGWIVGIRLAALALEAGETPEQVLTQMRQGGNRYAMDYLLAEVLTSQSPAITTFLLRTSILERFCTGVCSAVLDEAQAQASEDVTLDRLERLNLFLVRLGKNDGEDTDWYRYHHLFRDLLHHELRTRLSHDELAALHRKASAWFSDHGFTLEAIQHALAAGDDVGAAVLVEAQVHPLMSQERWRVLEQLINLLPDDLVRQRPLLLLAQAIMFAIKEWLDKVPPLIEQAQAALARTDLALDPQDVMVAHGLMDALRAQDLYFKNHGPEGLAAAERAMRQLPRSAFWTYGTALLFSGLLRHLIGQGDLGAAQLQRAIADEVTPTATSTRALLAMCHIYRQDGQLDRALEAARRMLLISQRHDFNIDASWAHYFIGCVAYERNDLDVAREHFLAVSEQRYHCNAICAYDGLAALALTYQAQGRLVEAEEALQELTDYAGETNLPDTYRAVSGVRALLALANGQPETALAFLPALDGPQYPLFYLRPLQITQAQILLGQEDVDSVRAASQRLEEVRAFAEATHSQWHFIGVVALQAVAQDRLGDRAGALTTLRQALVLAQPQRLIRTFVDVGPPMAALLNTLRDEGSAAALDAYIDRLLEAFPTSEQQKSPAVDLTGATPAIGDTGITEREIEVLQLLEQRYSNKEIAEHLVISRFTVRAHARSIFRKLDANDRRSAVVKARAAGLLSAQQ